MNTPAKSIYIAFILLIAAFRAYSQTPLIDSLTKIAERHTNDSVEIRALEQLSSEFARRDIDKSTRYVRRQIVVAKSLNTTFGLSGGYSWLVTMHQNAGNSDSSKYYLSLMEDLAKKNPDDNISNANYYNSAGLFYRNISEYAISLPLLKEALKYIRLRKDKTPEAGQLLNIGNAYQRMGDLKNAAAYHLESLALFREIGNKRGESFCLNSLGNDYLSLKQHKAAEKYYLQSAKLKEELGDKRGMISTWTSLSALYMEMSKYDLALDYARKCLQRTRELKTITDEASILVNMGRIYRDTKKIDLSRKTYDQALGIARKIGDSLLVSLIKSDVATIETTVQNNLKNEEQSMIKNVTVSLEKGDRPMSADAYHKLASWYADHDNYEKAFESLQRYNELDDSVRGSAVLLQFKMMEENFKNEQHEKEIALLKKDQELQNLELSRHKIINASIGIALVSVVLIAFLLINRYRVVNKAKRFIEIERVRNNIARDLHDDIGSTLSSINILSKVAIHEKNGDAQEYLQRIGDQSSRIMENMGDMVWSINPKNDSISQVVIKMREFASEMLESQNIRFHFSEKISPDLTINTDKRKNLFLIFKETINNAAKYSKANLVDISLEQRRNSLVLRITDDGQGFDENLVKRGNGLRNLRERGKEIGDIDLVSVLGTGTVMELVMPLT